MMNLFGKNQFEKEGSDSPAPQAGVSRYFFLLTNHFGKLLWVNLLFLVFSLPIVTCPAALCGMNRVLMKLVREGNCFVWDEFWKEWKAECFRALLPGVLFAAVLLLALWLFRLSIINVYGIGILFGAAGVIVCLLGCVANAYAFVMLPLLKLRILDILQNTVILPLMAGKHSLLVLGVTCLFVLIPLALFPFGILLLLLGWFAIAWLAICSIVYVPVDRYILQPHKAKISADVENPSQTEPEDDSGKNGDLTV